jgi:hypothetical protein
MDFLFLKEYLATVEPFRRNFDSLESFEKELIDNSDRE